MKHKVNEYGILEVIKNPYKHNKKVKQQKYRLEKKLKKLGVLI